MLRLVKLVLKFVAHRKLRSFLTTLGISIGVALVVSLVSINQGMLSYVEESFEGIGSDLVMILPDLGPGMAATSFSDEEKKAIDRLYFVKEVQGMDISMLQVEIRGEEFTTSIIGLEAHFLDLFGGMDNFEVEEGRGFVSGDTRKVIIGYLIAEEYGISSGSQILIGGEEYRVLGGISQVGNRADDTQIYMLLEDFWELTGRKDSYMMFYLTVVEPKTEEIEKVLKRIRGREDFTVDTMDNLMETVNDVLGILTAVFVAVASISILVGAVGVANTMYMAVLERTKEIGVMKAVGASQRDILLIFLFESGFLSLIGGATGMLLGFSLSSLLSVAAAQGGFTELKPVITTEMVILTAAASFTVGVLSGILPARQASKLQPVDALGYE